MGVARQAGGAQDCFGGPEELRDSLNSCIHARLNCVLTNGQMQHCYEPPATRVVQDKRVVALYRISGWLLRGLVVSSGFGRLDMLSCIRPNRGKWIIPCTEPSCDR